MGPQPLLDILELALVVVALEPARAAGLGVPVRADAALELLGVEQELERDPLLGESLAFENM